jgi:hypothetical protein
MKGVVSAVDFIKAQLMLKTDGDHSSVSLIEFSLVNLSYSSQITVPIRFVYWQWEKGFWRHFTVYPPMTVSSRCMASLKWLQSDTTSLQGTYLSYLLHPPILEFFKVSAVASMAQYWSGTSLPLSVKCGEGHTSPLPLEASCLPQRGLYLSNPAPLPAGPLGPLRSLHQ